LRYSALFFGIIYGFSHQRTLNANARAAHAENEYKHKESLIQKAKLEFAKKNMPPQAKTANGGGESFQRHSARSNSKLRNMKKAQSTDVLVNSHHQSRRQKLRPGSILELCVCGKHMIGGVRGHKWMGDPLFRPSCVLHERPMNLESEFRRKVIDSCNPLYIPPYRLLSRAV
jgi:hypothetical protein